MSFLTSNMAAEITNLISNAKIVKAIEKLQEYAHQANEKEAVNQCILLKGRLSSLQHSENLGLLNFTETNRERNIVTNSIINLVEQYTLSEKNQPMIVIQNNQNVNVFNFVISGVNFKDINQLEAWLNKPALNIEAHYTETLTLGKTIYSYLAFKWDNDKTTERYGANLKWSIEDLKTVKNLKNMQAVKDAVKALIETIKEFFYDEMEGDIMSNMYDKVLETSSLADFLFYYEIYYKKYLELNKTEDAAKPLLNTWYAAKNDLVTATTGKSLPFVDGKLENFKDVWGKKH
jgi:hypothetical protein